MDTNQTSNLHKKKFGQFFSGEKVAQLLYSLLPNKTTWSTVVDPMVGIGDMLMVVDEHSSSYINMLGIEIDPIVSRECTRRVPNAHIKNENAFKSKDLIIEDGWDLVITNPPYVRYQLQGSDDKGLMPTSTDIRTCLIRQIEQLKHLTKQEKELFLKVSKSYSGLSDMAVPAWILCAALVRISGYLAIVVPETWLSRNYASPIQYLISKLYHIEKIAKDSDLSWFPDAQVKTCLIVAKRKELSTIQSFSNQETTILEISDEDKICNTRVQKTISLFPYMLNGRYVDNWILGEDRGFVNDNLLPYELNNLLGNNHFNQFISLNEMGIECGQGLRTGANDFFYVKIINYENGLCLVHSNNWDHGGRDYHFPQENIIPALQKRGDIENLVVNQSNLKKAVVYLNDEVKDELKCYVDSGEQYADTKGRRFKDYSAVHPNEKIIDGTIIRHWYILPKFAKRHLPNLCMTRISSGVAECLYVKQDNNRPIVVDANMVTIWGKNQSANKIAFAILNSTWSKLNLELICTVMGAGALKIETSHLNKMLFPNLPEDSLSKLENIAEHLIKNGRMTPEIQNEIDILVLSPFDDESLISKCKGLLQKKIAERNRK